MRIQHPAVVFGLNSTTLILVTAAEVMTEGFLKDNIESVLQGQNFGKIAPLVAISAVIIGGLLAFAVRTVNESMERRRERREANLASAEEPMRQRDRARFLDTLATRYSGMPRPNEWLPLTLIEAPDLVRPRPDRSGGFASTSACDAGHASQQDSVLLHATDARTIADFYYAAEGHLLLVGEPGSGKTTLLGELAHALLANARADSRKPLPVLLNVATWTRNRLPLRRWLVEELVEAYHLDHAVAESWVLTEEIVPLLDGLDEVEVRYRAACAQAINDYQREHALVLSSRLDEYQALPTCSRAGEHGPQPLLQIVSAVRICPLPLDNNHIAIHLGSAGWDMEAVHRMLRIYPQIRGLYTTPFGLRTLPCPAHGTENGKASAAVRRDGEAIREHLLEAYVQALLQRDGRESRAYLANHITNKTDTARPQGYQADQAERDVRTWLGWLATYPGAAAPLSQSADALHPHGSSADGAHVNVFHPERLQPAWLPDGDVFNGHAMAIGLASVWCLGIAIGLIGAWHPSTLAGWLYGLVMGAAVGWFVRGDARLSMRVRWSWGMAILGFLCGLLFGPIGGFGVWLFFGLLAVVAQVGDWPQSWRLGIGVRLARLVLPCLALAGITVLLLALVAPDIPRLFPQLLALASPDLTSFLSLPGGIFVVLSLRILAGIALAIFAGFLPSGSGGDYAFQENQPDGPAEDLLQTGLMAVVVAGGIMLMVGIDSLLAGGSEGNPYMPFLAGLWGGVALAVFGGVSALLRALLLSRLVRRGDAPWSYERFLEFAVDRGILGPKGGGYYFKNEEVRQYLARQYLAHKPSATQARRGLLDMAALRTAASGIWAWVSNALQTLFRWLTGHTGTGKQPAAVRQSQRSNDEQPSSR